MKYIVHLFVTFSKYMQNARYTVSRGPHTGARHVATETWTAAITRRKIEVIKYQTHCCK